MFNINSYIRLLVSSYLLFPYLQGAIALFARGRVLPVVRLESHDFLDLVVKYMLLLAAQPVDAVIRGLSCQAP